MTLCKIRLFIVWFILIFFYIGRTVVENLENQEIERDNSTQGKIIVTTLEISKK